MLKIGFADLRIFCMCSHPFWEYVTSILYKNYGSNEAIFPSFDIKYQSVVFNN